jgi:hypothetical protein
LRVAACNGVLPFDTAFAADDAFVLAWLVANGENNGGTFEWLTGNWAQKK